tara:strand:- start:1548 stop:2810 length:1263 start_codon:yes stop_codon:yes gene_type:complete
MRPLSPLPDWLTLEHKVADILTQQELHGWYFDEKSAWELESTLRKELEETSHLLRDRHPLVKGSEFTPKRNNRTAGYIEGASFTRLKELNPTSRDHIAWILISHYGWTPSLISSNGKPVVDEIVLKDIGTDIAMSFLRCLELKKALGTLSEGVNAWLKLCTTSNRIHHHCSVATNTFRCAHRKPNLAQVNSDERFRKLFQASPGLVMCGADLCGIELRVLSHYLARYDGGRYAEILLNGDIHQTNADKIGITRRQVKTVTYAFLYGAGDEKIGLSVDKQLSKTKARAKGKEVRSAFIQAIPGLAELLSAVKKRSSTGKILAIDGRTLIVESRHKALNYLIQGSSAVIAKRWMLITNESLPETAHQLAFVHDELQFECEKKDVETLKSLLELSAAQAGEYYNLRVAIAAESKAGMNWAEVH